MSDRDKYTLTHTHTHEQICFLVQQKTIVCPLFQKLAELLVHNHSFFHVTLQRQVCQPYRENAAQIADGVIEAHLTQRTDLLTPTKKS